MASVHVQRWVAVVLDCSEAMTDTNDMTPSRLVRAARLLQVFVLRFFDKNPLSQLQIILTADGLAVPLTPLSGSAETHVSALRRLLQGDSAGSESHAPGIGNNMSQKLGPASDYRKHMLKGRMSLQNSVLVALKTLSSEIGLLHQTTAGATGTAPETTISKEVLLVLGGLSTQDPSNIFSTVEKAKRKGVAIDVIHLAADVYICRYLAERTAGRYAVALNEEHCQKALMQVADAPPPAVAARSSALNHLQNSGSVQKPTIPLLLMGFPGPQPSMVAETEAAAFQWLDQATSSGETDGLWCPRCLSRVDVVLTALHSKFISSPESSEIVLPTNCQACGLLLVKASHLARSYKSFILAPKFHRVKLPDNSQEHCTACSFQLRQPKQLNSSQDQTPKELPVEASYSAKRVYGLPNPSPDSISERRR